jgi:hypothetical protein
VTERSIRLKRSSLPLSPDGRSIAFISTHSLRTGLIPVGQTHSLEYRVFGGDLWITAAVGGSARRLRVG